MVVILVGPTASGKTAVSLALARELGAEIVYADSMCVYRGMEIGTAKPTPAERAQVTHHCLDLVEPTENFSVAEYARAAWAALEDCRRRERPVILSGGTGYYVRAVIDGIQHGPPPNPALREELEAFAAAHGNEALHARLQEVDLPRAKQLHPNDRKRVIRALEVWQSTGAPMSDLMEKQHPPPVALSDVVFVGLRRERGDLVERIDRRARLLFDNGLLDEVKALQERGVTLQHTAFQGHGYKEVVLGLQQDKPLEEICEDVASATRQYARRQMTWFNADPRLRWVDVAPDEPPQTTLQHVLAAMRD